MAARKPAARKRASRTGKPRFVSIPVARETMEWLEALYSSGALIVDRRGGVRFSPVVKSLLEGLHEALAGGKVSLSISSRGESGRRRELDSMLAKALDASNAISSSPGADVFSP